MDYWAYPGNVLNTDFALFSTFEDAVSGTTNRWTYCNYSSDRIRFKYTGFPLDCGPSGYVHSQWNCITRSDGRYNFAFFVVPYPSDSPSDSPPGSPSMNPSASPSDNPSDVPSDSPSMNPSASYVIGSAGGGKLVTRLLMSVSSHCLIQDDKPLTHCKSITTTFETDPHYKTHQGINFSHHGRGRSM